MPWWVDGALLVEHVVLEKEDEVDAESAEKRQQEEGAGEGGGTYKNRVQIARFPPRHCHLLLKISLFHSFCFKFSFCSVCCAPSSRPDEIRTRCKRKKVPTRFLTRKLVKKRSRLTCCYWKMEEVPALGPSTAVLPSVAAEARGRSWSGGNGVGQLLNLLGHSIHHQLVGVGREQRQLLLETVEGARHPGEGCGEVEQTGISIAGIANFSDLFESFGNELEEAGDLTTLLLYEI